MRAFIEENDTRTEVEELKVVSKGVRKDRFEALYESLTDTAATFQGQTDFALGVQTGLVAASIGLRGAIDD